MPNKKPISKKDQFTQTASDIFETLRKKTGADSKKVEEWQKKWLAMPKTRTQYKHWVDAPTIAIEEVLGMTNDIVDFVQGQEGSESKVFKAANSTSKEIAKDPKGFFKGKLAAVKAFTQKPEVQKAIQKAKETGQKGLEAAKKTGPGKKAVKKVNQIKKTIAPSKKSKK